MTKILLNDGSAAGRGGRGGSRRRAVSLSTHKVFFPVLFDPIFSPFYSLLHEQFLTDFFRCAWSEWVMGCLGEMLSVLGSWSRGRWAGRRGTGQVKLLLARNLWEEGEPAEKAGQSGCSVA
jgi:hypothetical protein